MSCLMQKTNAEPSMVPKNGMRRPIRFTIWSLSHLVGRSPFTTYRRNDGTFFFELSEDFVHLFAVYAESGGYFASRNRLACCTHGS